LALSVEKFPPVPESAADADRQANQSIPQKLCKKVLQCIVEFAEEHGLDRQSEIREVLTPVERYVERRNDKALLPFYLGYAASIVTANPLPMLVGAASIIAKGDKLEEENRNLQSIASETERRADVEKTGLLDETDHM
jgi:hypothetical protein